MKNVFTNSQDVIHLFAQKSQYSARCSNVYFEGDTIYSYGRHYELGRFMEINGEAAILIEDKGYSVTTAKHIAEIKQATRQYSQYFTTQVQLHHVYSRIKLNYGKLLNARKKDLYLPEILRSYEYFINSPFFSINDKKDIRFKELTKIYNSVSSPENIEAAKVAAKKALAKQQRMEAAKLKIDLKKFEAYEINSIYGANEDFLRISQDRQSVETSQYVKVSIDAAKVLYTAIANKQDIKGHKIDNYTVLSLNGVLSIGCHKINTKSMHKIGKIITSL
jgi:hypothetical protein